jgi:energy-coupling factor transporter ATP-binding protein EcfA2
LRKHHNPHGPAPLWAPTPHPQGLDPASRRNLWDVVKSNKAGRGIVLTTHSMEEAETLCDRLGIFVDGRLVCIGNPKEITSRWGRDSLAAQSPTLPRGLVARRPPFPTTRNVEEIMHTLCVCALHALRNCMCLPHTIRPTTAHLWN